MPISRRFRMQFQNTLLPLRGFLLQLLESPFICLNLLFTKRLASALAKRDPLHFAGSHDAGTRALPFAHKIPPEPARFGILEKGPGVACPAGTSSTANTVNVRCLTYR